MKKIKTSATRGRAKSLKFVSSIKIKQVPEFIVSEKFKFFEKDKTGVNMAPKDFFQRWVSGPLASTVVSLKYEVQVKKFKLCERLNDMSIRDKEYAYSEDAPYHILLPVLWHLLLKQKDGKKGFLSTTEVNIFYLKSSQGTIVVYFKWFSEDTCWYINASSLGDIIGHAPWNKKDCFFDIRRLR